MSVTTKETRFLLTAKDRTKVAFMGARKNLRGVGRAATGVQSQLLSLAGIAGGGVLIASFIQTNKEMQKLKSSLKTVTGSATEASKAFSILEEFAVKTPYELGNIVQSFIKLKALGLDPSEKALKSYGNTASAMGKNLDQLIEAVADAATGEFERLKEFGIKSKKQGDSVQFTFQKVKTTVKNNSGDITKYLQDIGNNQFASGMSDQMQNMEAAFSNFNGAIKKVQVSMGEAGLNKIITDLTNKTTQFITSLSTEDIEKFTREGMSGFADILEGVDATVQYISDNQLLREYGLLGYIIFGKKGLAGLVAAQEFMDGVAQATLNVGERVMGPSGITVNQQLESENKKLQRMVVRLKETTSTTGITNLKGMIQEQKEKVYGLSAIKNKLPDQKFKNNYQLGDFNNFNGDLSSRQWADQFISRNLKGGGSDKNHQIDKTNTLLKEIIYEFRKQSNVATAG